MIQREHNGVSSRTAALRGQGLLVKPHEARRLLVMQFATWLFMVAFAYGIGIFWYDLLPMRSQCR